MVILDASNNKGVDVKASAQSLYVAPVANYTTALTSGAGSVTVSTAPGVLYGFWVISSGSSAGTAPLVSYWDGLTSAGTTLASSVALGAAGSFLPALGSAGAGIGLRFRTGLTVQNSSGATVYPIIL